MTGDEQGQRLIVLIRGPRRERGCPRRILDRLPVGVLLHCECLEKSRMHLALSLHRRNAACVRQPVGDLLLRTSEGKHQVRGFILRDPLARESLSLVDVDDVQE